MARMCSLSTHSLQLKTYGGNLFLPQSQFPVIITIWATHTVVLGRQGMYPPKKKRKGGEGGLACKHKEKNKKMLRFKRRE
jgi:hypothetical protein